MLFEDRDSVEVQGIGFRHGGAHPALVALGTTQLVRPPAAAPALNASQQGPVDGLGTAQHIDVGVGGEVQGRQDVGDEEELVRSGHPIWCNGQRNGDL